MSITGIGAVTGFGLGANPLWQAARNSQTCISNGLGRIQPRDILQLQSQFELAAEDKDNLALLLTLSSIQEAFSQAGWKHFDSTDGLILATTTGQIPMWDHELYKTLAHRSEKSDLGKFIENQPLGCLLKKAVDYFKFPGKTLLLTSACSASTQAIGLAQQWIQSGRVNRCLVGGTEVLCDLTINGFSSLQLLSKNECKPFDSTRDGINLSEGSAYLCLERVELGSRQTRTLAYLRGQGSSLDGYHMTAPHPEGHGTVRAIHQALASANIRPNELSWIHAHGTGSVHNDLAEGNAFSQLKTDALISSTKSIHGHALGAVGAIESVLIVKALQEQFVLGTRNLTNLDPKIRLPVLDHSKSTKLVNVLKNTAGFGGSNSALVFSSEAGSEL